MTAYPISNNENKRLQELFNYQILDSPIGREFDELVQTAVAMFPCSVAAITFIDATRQWIKSIRGLDVCEMDRNVSVCNYTIAQNELFEVEDLQLDERFKNFPYVASDPHYRSYVGVSLTTVNGYKIGTFCIVDTAVRRFNETERIMLATLARQAMKQVELRLENLQLEKINQQQRHITSILSHDIKNPLSNIKMALSLQQSGDDLLTKEETGNMNNMLAKQVDGAISMLNNITKWGRLQIHGDKEELEYANLRQLADEVMAEINSTAKHNVLVNAIPASINILADEEGVRFALRNLLTNANKFTARGCIVISHEKKGGKNYIHVTDTGVGMSKEQTDNLNTNKPVNSSYGTNNEKGNGLGLGLLHDYFAQRGGQLYFQSEIGRGTKATFTL